MAKVLVRPIRCFWAGKRNGVGHMFSLKAPKGPSACGRIVKVNEEWVTPPPKRLCFECQKVEVGNRKPISRKGVHGASSKLAADDAEFSLSGVSSRGKN